MKIVFKLSFISLALLLWGLFSGCEKGNKEVRYYPSTKEFNKSKKNDIIGIDTLSINYDSLLNRFYENYMNGVKTVIEIKNKGISRKIMFIDMYNACIRSRNVLMISEDSIYKESGFSISELDNVLRKHYFNINRNDEYSDSYQRALINIALDTGKTILKLRNDLKKSLLNLAEIFDKIKEDTIIPLNLLIYLDNNSRFPPPALDPTINIEIIYQDSTLESESLKNKLSLLSNSNIFSKKNFEKFERSLAFNKKSKIKISQDNSENPKLVYNGKNSIEFNVEFNYKSNKNNSIVLSLSAEEYSFVESNFGIITYKKYLYSDILNLMRNINKSFKNSLIVFYSNWGRNTYYNDYFCEKEDEFFDYNIKLIPRNFKLKTDTLGYKYIENNNKYQIKYNSTDWVKWK